MKLILLRYFLKKWFFLCLSELYLTNVYVYKLTSSSHSLAYSIWIFKAQNQACQLIFRYSAVALNIHWFCSTKWHSGDLKNYQNRFFSFPHWFLHFGSLYSGGSNLKSKNFEIMTHPNIHIYIISLYHF